MDYLSRYTLDQFAPARTLPPKPFDYSVFQELPACLDAVQPSDPAWVRALLTQRLNETMIHYAPRWGRTVPESPEAQIESMQNGGARYHREADGLLKLLNGLERIPEGQAWLATNLAFLQAIRQVASEAIARSGPKTGDEKAAGWLSLSNRLHGMLPGVAATPATNRGEPASSAPP